LVHPLKKARLDAGLSVNELSERVGISRQMIYFLEAGQQRGSVDTWLKISEVLNRPMDELVGGQEKAVAG